MIYVTGEVYSKSDATRKLECLFKTYNLDVPCNDFSSWDGDQLHRYDQREIPIDHDSAALFLNFYYDEEESDICDMDVYTWEFYTAYFDHETGFSKEVKHELLADALKTYEMLDNLAWKDVL